MSIRYHQSATGLSLSTEPAIYYSQTSDNSQSKLPALLESLSSERILRLEDQFLGDRGASVLADFLTKHTHFVSIELRGNNITSASFVVICKALKSSSNLRNLKAEWNLIGDGGDITAMEALSELASALPSLQTIDLRNNKIGKGCGLSLASIIKDAWSLQKLDLRWNELTDSDAKYILEALRSSRRNVHISLGGNKNNGQRISETLVLEINKCAGDLNTSFQEQSSFSSTKRYSPPSKTTSSNYLKGKSAQYQSTTAATRTHSRNASRRSPVGESNYYSQGAVSLKNRRSESKENRQINEVQKRLEFIGDYPPAKPLQTRNSSSERRIDQAFSGAYKSSAKKRNIVSRKPSSLVNSQNFGDILEERSDLPSRDSYQLSTSPNKHSLSPNRRESNYTSVKTSPNKKPSPHSKGSKRKSPGAVYTPETKMTNTSTVEDSTFDIHVSRIDYEKGKNLMQRRNINPADRLLSSEENMIEALEKMLEAERLKNIELARNIKRKLQEEIDEERKAKLAAIQKEEQLKLELKRKMVKEEELHVEMGRLASECERLLIQKQSISDELVKAKTEQSLQINELTTKNEAQVQLLNEEIGTLKNELRRIIDKHTQELRHVGKEWENECLKLGAEANQLKIQLKGMALDQENEILQMEKRVREEEFLRYQAAIAELTKKREENDKKSFVDKRESGTSPLKGKLNEMHQDNEYILSENNILRSQLKEAILLNQELEVEFTSKEQRLREVEQRLQEAVQSSQKIKELHQKEIEKVVSGHRIERKSWEEVEGVLKTKISELERDIERIKEEGKKIKTEYYGMKQLIQGNVNRVITDTFKDHRAVDRI